MTKRYRLFRRGGLYYSHDGQPRHIRRQGLCSYGNYWIGCGAGFNEQRRKKDVAGFQGKGKKMKLAVREYSLPKCFPRRPSQRPAKRVSASPKRSSLAPMRSMIERYMLQSLRLSSPLSV